MSAAVQPSTSQASTSASTSKPAPTTTTVAARSGIKIESKPIQWATSTGATVLQHLAAQREQGKLKNTNGTTINRDDLINSKPASTSAPAAKAHPKGNNGTSTNTKNGNRNTTTAATSRLSPSASSSSSASTSVAKTKTTQTAANQNGKSDSESKDKPARRRKANRACSHCQKAHLTCDDSRPCERCVKKGLADTCTDGARKKAKYLLDDDELLELKKEKERKAAFKNLDESFDQSQDEGGRSTAEVGEVSIQQEQPTPVPLPFGAASMSNPNWGTPNNLNMTGFAPPNGISPNEMVPFIGPLGDGNMDQQRHADLYSNGLNDYSPASGQSGNIQNVFGSENASLEYSILSSMLNGIDPTWLSGSPENQAGPSNGTPDNGGMGDVYQNTSAFSHMGIDSMPWQLSNQQTASSNIPSWRDPARTPGNTQSYPDPSSQSVVEPLHHLDATSAMGGGATPAADAVAAYDALEVPSPKDGLQTHNQMDAVGRAVLDAKQHGHALANASEQDVQASKAAAAAAAAGLDHKPDAVWKERVKHIYGDKTRPFPYTEGYHFLIKYATANFEKAEVLRIVRSLAIFRPSLIALQMPLTEDDEVFVERSIQRTILEFEKLISFSGTPTVVWRRTCEIVVVGNEFSMLSQWSKEYLMGRYIYEFFDKPSILEYWEKFALHAFENTAQSIMMPVTLKTSTGQTTKCAACFSIKRDIFDLPSLIVGNFLPILS
ncbi:hypothetical protein L7F22_052836 [Adiantum nelumboides]|nr:hypothetical protein [Adiantum nelumboides]